MKLINFQIKNYKIIDDTKPVKVDPKVTALVGKNESGKTAVLKAMWKSQNVAGAAFDKLYDYPRDRYSRDRRDTQEVTILEFELTPEGADIPLAFAQTDTTDPGAFGRPVTINNIVIPADGIYSIQVFAPEATELDVLAVLNAAIEVESGS